MVIQNQTVANLIMPAIKGDIIDKEAVHKILCFPAKSSRALYAKIKICNEFGRFPEVGGSLGIREIKQTGIKCLSDCSQYW